MVTDTLRQLICGVIHGHEDLLQIADGKISLRCPSCGYETPGWDLRPAPPGRIDGEASGYQTTGVTCPPNDAA